jgi:REP element-mobilizing transposase RayT
MARQQRYHSPGAYYHVMLRGNNGQTIFFRDIDRCRMCLLIQEGVERFGHRIHAFCLMGNHVHLLVQVGNTPLSKIIHNLSFRYSQFINRRHQKIGHLFQGRFKAILIQVKTYFLRLLRYIHMNPVRARLVKEPNDYPWSAHGAYLGDTEFAWLTTNYGLSKFASNLEEARLKYRDYVLKEESEEELKELRQGFSDGQVLGDDTFLEDIRNSRSEPLPVKFSIPIIIDAICEVYDIDQIALASSFRSKRLSIIRGAAVFLGRQNGHTLEELAKAFNRDGSSLGRLMFGFSQKHACSVDVQNQFRKLEEVVARFSDMQA